ncbi:MAG: ABC transporter ATP-binding protein, partial [Parcubacteria group bacterium]|nr:ABC transporter ATP-binding protein [Parcubacteria group bacterium]
FGFLGPNGAGKTTTIRCLMDFLRPTEGEINILGKDAQKDSVELKKDIGYLSGSVKLYSKWTGQMHLDYFKKLNGKYNITDKLIKRFDFNPSVKTKNLSSGNKQKLGIILAFMFEPKILIFDEPTNALDPLLQNEVYELIKEQVSKGSTVFMSSHNLGEVERVCSRVGIIKKGKMVAEESILKLKDKKLYDIKVCFEEKVDQEELKKNGIEVAQELPNCLILKAKGDINPVIQKLSQYKLRDLNIERANLEDIFMEFYEN